MRSIFAVATAVLLFSAGVELAHAGGCSGKRGRVSLSEGLGLTEEQIASLTSLREEMVAQKQALREEYRDAFEELLTPEQLELLAERGGRFGGHKRDDVDEDGGAGDDGGSTSDQLSLQASTVPTAVEETSWGSIKNSLR